MKKVRKKRWLSFGKSGRIRVRLSLPFLIFSAVMLITDNGVLFATYLCAVLLHEYAHHLLALRFGLVMDEIRLEPSGAVLYGELSGLSPVQEIAVALIGPLFNLAVALLCLALWWVAPSFYPYTDLIMLSNLTLGLFNLLPVYPLDGGRVLLHLLCFRISNRRAFAVLRRLSAVISLAFFAAYLYSAFHTINYTLAIASVTVAFSLLEEGSEISSRKAFAVKGMFLGSPVIPVKCLAVKESATLYQLLGYLNADNCYEITVYCEKTGGIIAKLSHKDVEALFEQYPLSSTVGKSVEQLHNSVICALQQKPPKR